MQCARHKHNLHPCVVMQVKEAIAHTSQSITKFTKHETRHWAQLSCTLLSIIQFQNTAWFSWFFPV